MNGGPDAGSGDMAKPADMAMGGDMAMAVNNGTQIFKGKAASVYGITADDNAVIVNSMGMFGVPLAGGNASQVLGTTGTWFNRGAIVDKFVYGWDNFDQNISVGELTVWTLATGPTPIPSAGAASPLTRVAFSDDGQFMLWFGNSTDGLHGDMMVSKTDGTMQTTLVQMVQTDSMGCWPQVGFVGGQFLVGHCDGTDTTGKIDRVATDGTITNLVAMADVNWFADKGGKKVAYTDGMGNLFVIPITGGMSTMVDGKFKEGTFLPDGSAVVYLTSDGNLRNTVPGMAPKTLVMGVQAFANTAGSGDSLSPDGKYIVYNTQGDFPSDLYMIATAGGMPTTLTASMNGAIFGDAYTTDSTRAVYYTPTQTATVSMGNALIGTLVSLPVSGGMPTTHATAVWDSHATAKPTGLIYNDNWKKGQGFGRADLRAAGDITTVSMTAPGMLVASQAEADIFLNPARTKVVYSSQNVTGKEGIYSFTLP